MIFALQRLEKYKCQQDNGKDSHIIARLSIDGAKIIKRQQEAALMQPPVAMKIDAGRVLFAFWAPGVGRGRLKSGHTEILFNIALEGNLLTEVAGIAGEVEGRAHGS